MTKLEKLMEVIESHDYAIHPYSERGKLCGYEIETWTDGGVNMNHFIDCRSDGMSARNPDDVMNELKTLNAYYDVDEMIALHRMSNEYCEAFTTRQSVEDFEAYEKRMREMVCAAVTAIDEWKGDT